VAAEKSPKRPRGQSRETTLVAVGDVVVSRQPPEEAFAKVLDELKSGTFSCCNFEAPLSNKGMPQYGKFETLHAAPEMIAGFVHAGFKVVSLANNHSMDYGPEALLDTIERIDSGGILHAGAGRNAEEARMPAVFEVGGMRFAFVSFATEAFLGYGAHAQKPGIAVIRRDPLYGPSCVNPDDVRMMKEIIQGAKKEAEFVIAAFHWGLSQSRALTRSQLTLGRAAVDAGAGLVVGHHPHVLQGIEVYKRSLILYSLGNFVFDLMPEFLGPATRDTVLVKVKLAGKAVREAVLLPAWINVAGQPEIAGEGSSKNLEILGLLRSLSAARKTNLAIKGGIGTVRVGR
jgi:poly-gamma-glutamate capsule biosynthesis protein CapA/YwtB (metallophosphatase superfamily)